MKRIKGDEVILLSRSTYSGISIKMERGNPKSIKSNTLDKISYEFFLFHQLQFHSHCLRLFVTDLISLHVRGQSGHRRGSAFRKKTDNLSVIAE